MKQWMMCLILLLVPVYCSADIYKWVDENGKVHYSDKKPVSQSVEKVKVDVNTYEATDYPDAPAEVEVIMYATSWCGYCKKARQYFQRAGIRYTEYDIEKNLSAKREYDRIGGRGVPVILVNKQKMNGFSRKGFDALYSRASNSAAR